MKGSYAKQVYLLFCTLTEVMILSSYNVNVTLHHVYAWGEERINDTHNP